MSIKVRGWSRDQNVIMPFQHGGHTNASYDFAYEKRLVGNILNKIIVTCDSQTGTIFIK